MCVCVCVRELPSLPQYGSRTRRVKLVMDREYETSSTGKESAPEPQRPNRLTSSVKSHANGSVYVAQNGSIVRTRRAGSGVTPVQAHTTPTNDNLLSSPVLGSRLAKHFRKLEKMAATLEERIPPCIIVNIWVRKIILIDFKCPSPLLRFKYGVLIHSYKRTFIYQPISIRLLEKIGVLGGYI